MTVDNNWPKDSRIGEIGRQNINNTIILFVHNISLNQNTYKRLYIDNIRN